MQTCDWLNTGGHNKVASVLNSCCNVTYEMVILSISFFWKSPNLRGLFSFLNLHLKRNADQNINLHSSNKSQYASFQSDKEIKVYILLTHARDFQYLFLNKKTKFDRHGMPTNFAGLYSFNTQMPYRSNALHRYENF